jgi:hypothetical protein
VVRVSIVRYVCPISRMIGLYSWLPRLLEFKVCERIHSFELGMQSGES